jgi:hypothetical protein
LFIADPHPFIASRHHSTGRIDVDMDVSFAILRIQVKQLRNEEVGRVSRDGPTVTTKKYDPVLQKSRKNISARCGTLIPAL